MTAALLATTVLALGVGLSLGLLGGGGSILTVPLLVYVTGLEATDAAATSLVVVGTTAAVSALPHARAGRVRWRTGAVFGAAGVAGSFAGGLVGGRLPGQVLLGAFALMMIAASVSMLRGRRGGNGTGRELPLRTAVATGVLVGFASGLVGAGGGFLIVPALALLGGLPMPAAIGTSLMVIAMQSLGGVLGYLTSVRIDWGVAALVTAAAVGGALVGARLVDRVPAAALRRLFGWFVLAMGALVLAQQLPSPWALPVLAAGSLAVAGCLLWRGCPLRAGRTGFGNAGSRWEAEPSTPPGMRTDGATARE